MFFAKTAATTMKSFAIVESRGRTFEAAGYWIYCWEQAIDSALGPILAVSRVLRERGDTQQVPFA